MATYGYVRVSSADQNEDRQTIAMSGVYAAKEDVFTEKQSGRVHLNI